ncbi:MAG: hypothetical protein ACREGB_01665 [Candidatus Saccharimonadales bacterium]
MITTVRPEFITYNGRQCEQRQYVVLRESANPNGRSYRVISCPFCESSVVAYIWSLSGGGKRCHCKVMFDAYGWAIDDRKKKP